MSNKNESFINMQDLARDLLSQMSGTVSTKVSLLQAMREQFGPGRWVRDDEHPITPCPECGCSELLCGFPKKCCSENKESA
jgi:hypothetical protein